MQLSKLSGQGWKLDTARAGFPVLVEYARARKAITYGEWREILFSRGLIKRPGSNEIYGWVAGNIGDACNEYGDAIGSLVPPINLLVINKETGLPGKGAKDYAERFCREKLGRRVNYARLSDEKKMAIIKEAQEEIFAFKGWEEILRAYGLRPSSVLKAKHTDSDIQRVELPKFNPSEWHTGPESEAHKALKEKIKQAPRLVGLPQDLHGKNEHLLPSGDRLDVFFATRSFGVEVKTSDAPFEEIRRGLFQCVKYCAVLKAQQIGAGHIPSANCVLALAGSLPQELRFLAKALAIEVFDDLSE